MDMTQTEITITITATPVNYRSTQKVWRVTTVEAASQALELVKASPAFDCVKVEYPGGWQQFERDGAGTWQTVHDYNAQGDNALIF